MPVKKILIVEDESAILRALETIFKREGFATIRAVDGDEGIEAARREMPDLIIFDVIMPRIDGITMLSKIRNEGGEWGKNIKAIVYTNIGYEEIRDKARKLGVSEFLVKANVRLADLVIKAKEVLGLTGAS